MDKLNLGRFNIVGHSNGGRVVFYYAAEHPEHVTRAVIVDIDPDPANPETSRMFNTWYYKEPDEWDSLQVVVDRLRERAPNAPEDVLRHQAIAMTKELPGGRRAWKRDRKLLFGFQRPDAWDKWRSIKPPVLLIRGGNSNLLSQPLADKMLAARPGTRFTVVPGGSHWCYDENLPAFVQTLKGFLKEAA